MSIVRPTETAARLTLTAAQEGVGGLSGLTVTAALRRRTDDFYLDWSDQTFKAAGWATKYGAAAEVERGHYDSPAWNVATSGASDGQRYVAEWRVNFGGGLIGDASEDVEVVDVDAQLSAAHGAGAWDAPAVSGTAALQTTAIAAVVATGVETNDFTATREVNGTSHVIDDVGNAIDLHYEFDVGFDGIPVEVKARANLQSNNDELTVYGWNWGAAAWEAVGVLPGSGSASLDDFSWPLLSTHVGTAADLGRVRVRFAGGSSNPRLDMDFLTVGYAVVPRTAMFQGVATAGGPSTITFPAGASALDDFYRPALVVIIGGTGVGQSRRVDSYAGATRVATVSTPWVTQPDATSQFVVLAWASVRVSEIDDDAITAASIAAGAITASEAPALANLDAAVSSRAAPGDAMALTAGERLAVAQAMLAAALPSGETVEETLDLLRKALTNRLEASPGNPGTTILYDDDGTTPILTWALRDETGSAINAAPGAPARRETAT